MDTFVCNICMSNLEEARYKCISCIDYDVCEKCLETPGEEHKDHIFLKISGKRCDNDIQVVDQISLADQLAILDAMQIFQLDVEVIANQLNMPTTIVNKTIKGFYREIRDCEIAALKDVCPELEDPNIPLQQSCQTEDLKTSEYNSVLPTARTPEMYLMWECTDSVAMEDSVNGAIDIHLLSKWFDMKEGAKSYHKDALLRVQSIGGMMNKEPSLQSRVLKTCEAVVPGTNRHMVKYRQDLAHALKKQSRSRTATAVNHIVNYACSTHFTSDSVASKKDTSRKRKQKHIHSTSTGFTIPEQQTDSESECEAHVVSTEVGGTMQAVDSLLPAHQRVTRAMRQNAADVIGVDDAHKPAAHPTLQSSSLFNISDSHRVKRKRSLLPGDLMDIFGPDDIAEDSPQSEVSPFSTRNEPFTSPSAVLTANSYSSPFYSSPSLNENGFHNKKRFLSPHELALVEHQLHNENAVEETQHNISSATEMVSTAGHNTVCIDEAHYYDLNQWAIMLYIPPIEKFYPSKEILIHSTTTDAISSPVVEYKCTCTVPHSAPLRLLLGWFKMQHLILKYPWKMRYSTMFIGITAHIKSDWNRVSVNSIIYPVTLRLIQYNLIASAVTHAPSIVIDSPETNLEINSSSILRSVAEECTAIRSILKKRTIHESHEADRNNYRELAVGTKCKEVHFDITASMLYKRWRVGKIATFCPQTAMEEEEIESGHALTWKKTLTSQSHDDVFFTAASSEAFITSDRVKELSSQESNSLESVSKKYTDCDTVTPMPSILKKRSYNEVSPAESANKKHGSMPKKRVHFSPDVCTSSKERTGMYQSLRRRCPWFFAERSRQFAKQRSTISNPKVNMSGIDETSREHENKNYSTPFEYHPERILLTSQALSQQHEELNNSDTDTETDESVELNISFSHLPPHVDDDIPPLSEDFLDTIVAEQQKDEDKLSSPISKSVDPTLCSIHATRGMVDRSQWNPEVDPCALGSFLDEACCDDVSTGPSMSLLTIVENHSINTSEVGSRKRKKVIEEEEEDEEESPFFVEDAMILAARTAVTVVTPENHLKQQSKGEQWLWSEDRM